MLNRILESAAGDVDTIDVVGVNDWRRAVSGVFVPLQVRSENPDLFRGRIRSRILGGINISEVSASEQVAQRTAPLTGEKATLRYMLCLQLEGTGIVMQDNREAVLKPGDISVYDMDRPYSLVFEDRFSCLAVMLPRELLGVPPRMVAELTAARFAGDDGVARVVSPFLVSLGGNLTRLPREYGTRLVANAVDMVATVFLSQLGTSEREAPNSHRRDLLHEILAYIDNNLADPELNPARIAAAHFISTRHLYDIFSEQELTVAGWIRTRRLEQCKRDLSDQLRIEESIATIAARAGFLSPSHFSQAFRRSFGESASEFRSRTVGTSGQFRN
nr:helix-turn-helix domain-containing protein [Rhodococcus sp. ABRD24]